jgi:flagellar motility protein MotE (MotC chaperone)
MSTMTTTETEERKRIGRPRRYGERIVSTVRHTPQLYAELKASAEQAGRSISEQVEFELEEFRRIGPKLDSVERSLEAYAAGQEKLVEKYEARIKRLEGHIDAYKKNLESLTEGFGGTLALLESIPQRLLNDRASTDERIARIVATAVAQANAATDDRIARIVAAAVARASDERKK